MNKNSIPKGLYCDGCPYLIFRKYTKKEIKKFMNEYPLQPEWTEQSRTLEYCKYLHQNLSIQDEIKDCNINNDFDEKDINK
jgi:hypothetical protein